MEDELYVPRGQIVGEGGDAAVAVGDAGGHTAGTVAR